MATISFDLSATLTCPSTRRWRCESRHHVDRRLSSSLVRGAAHRLAIDGDHVCRHAKQLGDPGDEATLEFSNR